MKYSININQLALAETQLDIIDAAILEYIYYYCTSQNPKIIQNRVCEGTTCWTWIDYKSLLVDMPLLRIKTSHSLSPRIDRIRDDGFIKTRRQGHQKLYFAITAKCDELIVKTIRANRENDQPTTKANRKNDRIIILGENDNNTIDSGGASASGKIINDLIDKFKNVNPNHERLFANINQRKALERMVKKYGAEKLGRMIDALPELIVKPFYPKITTPYELEVKMGALIAKVNEDRRKAPFVAPAYKP